MKEVTVSAHAKINLYLEVTSRLPDGYHALESTMHAVSLADEVTVAHDGLPGIRLTCSDPALPCGESNLACRAARAFFAHTGISGGIRIHIRKVIPEGAGLAGGSADAAAVLRALNDLFRTELDPLTLRRIGKTIGADVPFCLHRGAAEVRGIGEIITPCFPLPPCHLLIAEGDAPVSTPRAFAQLDQIHRQVRTGNPMTRLLREGRLDQICAGLYNAFEAVVPSCHAVKEQLYQLGASGALMSGSGSAVFALFAGRHAAETAREHLRNAGRRAWVCKVEREP